MNRVCEWLVCARHLRETALQFNADRWAHPILHDPLKRKNKKKGYPRDRLRATTMAIANCLLLCREYRDEIRLRGYHLLNLCSNVSWKISYMERTFRETDGRKSRRNFFMNIVHEGRTLHPLSFGYREFVRSCRLHGVRDTLTYWVTCRNWATHPCGHVWPIFVVVRFAAKLVSIGSGSLRRWVRFDAARAADNNIRDRKPARWHAQTHVASSDALGKRKERLANDHRGRMIYSEKERTERAAN